MFSARSSVDDPRKAHRLFMSPLSLMQGILIPSIVKFVLPRPSRQDWNATIPFGAVARGSPWE